MNAAGDVLALDGEYLQLYHIDFAKLRKIKALSLGLRLQQLFFMVLVNRARVDGKRAGLFAGPMAATLKRR